MPRCATSSRPGLAAVGAREGALLVAEELRLQELAREARAVQVHERLLGARPVLVEPAREHALAGAGLALDQHGAVGARARLPRRARRARGSPGSSPRNGSRSSRASARAAGQLLLPVALVLEQPLEDHGQGVGSSTGFVRNCSAPSLIARTARSIEPCAVRMTTGTRGVAALEARQQIERVAVGQRVVDDRDVRRRLAERRLGLARSSPPPSTSKPRPRRKSQTPKRTAGSSSTSRTRCRTRASHGRPHPVRRPAAARSRRRRPRPGCPRRSGRRGPRRCAGRSRGRAPCRRARRVKNGSKMRGRSSGRKPGPASRTRQSTHRSPSARISSASTITALCGGACAHRVVEQVLEDLRQPPAVHRARAAASATARVSIATPARSRPAARQPCDRLGDDLGDRALAELEAGRLAVLEQVAHEVREPLELAAQDRDVLRVLPALAEAGLERVERRRDPEERVADLVGDAGDERAHRRHRAGVVELFLQPHDARDLARHEDDPLGLAARGLQQARPDVPASARSRRRAPGPRSPVPPERIACASSADFCHGSPGPSASIAQRRSSRGRSCPRGPWPRGSAAGCSALPSRTSTGDSIASNVRCHSLAASWIANWRRAWFSSAALRSVTSRSCTSRPGDARVVREVAADRLHVPPRPVAVAHPELGRRRARSVDHRGEHPPHGLAVFRVDVVEDRAPRPAPAGL